jgi:hypothetical protein
MSGIAKADWHEYIVSGYDDCGKYYNNTVRSFHPLTQHQIDYANWLVKTQITCGGGSSDNELEYCCDVTPDKACPYLAYYMCGTNGFYYLYETCSDSNMFDNPCDCYGDLYDDYGGSDEEYEGSDNDYGNSYDNYGGSDEEYEGP